VGLRQAYTVSGSGRREIRHFFRITCTATTLRKQGETVRCIAPLTDCTRYQLEHGTTRRQYDME
jgi:hypothetical protein